MKAFAALLRVSMTALLKSISPGKAGVAVSVGLMAGLSVLMSLMFGGILTVALAPLGALDLVPGFLCVMAAAMAFLFTAFGAGGLLFGGKDNDLLLALPIPDWMLLTARLLAVYLENLLNFALTLLPGMIFYCAAKGSPVGFLLAVPVAVFGTLIPTLLASLVGWAVTWIASHTRHNALLANLGYGLVILGSFGFSLAINVSTRTGMMEGDAMAEGLGAAFRGPLWLFGRMGAACAGDLAAMAVTLLCSILPAVLFVLLLRGSYRHLLTRMGARAARRKYRMTAQRSASPMRALLRKESIRFFHTPIYLFNTGFGLILLVAAVAAICWKRDAVLSLLAQEMEIPLSQGGLYGALAGTVCFLLATVCTSSVSLSLEGRSLWILKSLPVPAAQILRAKVCFNLLVGWPLTALCIVVLWGMLGFTPLQGIALLACSAALAWFVSLLGAAANLSFPRLDAANDTVICKQSLSAVIGIFGGMVLVGGGIGLCLALQSLLGTEAYLLICAVLLAGLSLLLDRWLCTAGARRLSSLG